MTVVAIPVRDPEDTGELFPVAPLLTIAAEGAHTAATAALALRLGVSRRQVYRWAHQGLTAAQADVAAVRLGRHPVEVWPDLW